MSTEGSDVRIREMDRPLQIWSCIYFLVGNSKLIYIGKATELYRRVLCSNHHVFREDKVDRIFYIQIPGANGAELEAIERVLIRRFAPIENTTVSRAGPKDVAVYHSLVGDWAIDQLMKMFKEHAIDPFSTDKHLSFKEIGEIAKLMAAKQKAEDAIEQIEEKH